MYIIKMILSGLFVLTGVFGAIGAILLFPIVIVSSFMISKEVDEIEKKKKIKKMIIFAATPFIFIFISLMLAITLRLLG